MSPRLTLALALGLTVPAVGQQSYVVTNQGHPVGTAHLTQRLLPDGSKVVELLMTFTQGKQKTYVRTRSEYAKDGKPKHMYQLTNSAGGTKKRQTNVDFGPVGAFASRNDGSGWKHQEVDLADSEPKAALSEFWFLRDVPEKGATCKAFVFDLERLQWDLRTTTYVGPVTVKVKGKSLSAHQVTTQHNDKSVIAYLDSKGWPIRIESGDTVIERDSL